MKLYIAIGFVVALVGSFAIYQFSAERFKNMVKCAFHKSGYLDEEPGIWISPHDHCFESNITEAEVDLEEVVQSCATDHPGVTSDGLEELYDNIANYDSVTKAIANRIHYLTCLFKKSEVFVEGQPFNRTALSYWYDDSLSEVIDLAVAISDLCSSGENAAIEDDFHRTFDYTKCAVGQWPQIFEETTTSVDP